LKEWQLFDVNYGPNVKELKKNRTDLINLFLSDSDIQPSLTEQSTPEEIVKCLEKSKKDHYLFIYDEYTTPRNDEVINPDEILKCIFPDEFANANTNMTIYSIAIIDYHFKGNIDINTDYQNLVVFLPPLRRDEMAVMLCDTYSNELHLSDSIINLFWKFSGGNPFLAKLLCTQLIETVNEQKLPFIQPVSVTISEIIKAIRILLEDKYFYEEDNNFCRNANTFSAYCIQLQKQLSEKEKELIGIGFSEFNNETAQRLCHRNFFWKVGNKFEVRIKSLQWFFSETIPCDLFDKFSALSISDFTIDANKLRIKGETIPSSHEEMRCLKLLIDNYSTTVDYYDLLDAIRDNSDTIETPEPENMVEIIIISLKRRLGDVDILSPWIVNEEIGYYIEIK